MNIKVPNIAKTSPLPIIKPLLNPIVINNTPTTVITDIIKFNMKLFIEFATKSG